MTIAITGLESATLRKNCVWDSLIGVSDEPDGRGGFDVASIVAEVQQYNRVNCEDERVSVAEVLPFGLDVSQVHLE